jgi:integrase
MTFQSQAETFMSEIALRKSDPAKVNTLRVYRSIIDFRLLPAIGGLELQEVNNRTVKVLVGRLAEADLSPATITLAVSLVKQVVKSAVDDEGNQLYPRTWNTRFIDAPKIDKSAQRTPIATSLALGGAVAAVRGEVGGLVALLAGTGLRVGEALAMHKIDDGVSNYWDPAAGTIAVRATLVNGKLQDSTKTKAGTRIVDLDPALNSLLHSVFAIRDSKIFVSSERTLRRRIEELGLEGFHSMRRFRITHLQAASVPATLVKFWAGHAAGDVSERYTKFGEQIMVRKTWADKAGLGFDLHA